MSIIPPSAVGSLAAPAPVNGGGSVADGDLAGVFAALVDSLQAELASGEQPAEPAFDARGTSGSTDADAIDGDADAAGALAVLAVPAPLPVWPASVSALAPPDAGADAPIAVTLTIAPVPVETDPAAAVDEAALVVDLGHDTQFAATVGDTPVETAALPADPTPAPAAEATGERTDDGAHADPGTETIDTEAIDAGTEQQLPAAGAGAELPVATTPDPSATAGPSSRVTATATTTAPTEVAAPAAGPQTPALPDQLVRVIAPLRRGVDGSHQVSIQLRPDELGEVLVEMHVRGNEISLSLRADLVGTSDLLRQSLDELRAQLEAAGFRSGALDVDSHADPRSAPDRDTQRSGPTPEDVAAHNPTEQPPTPTGAVPTVGLDLRI